jgi:hypothetical protein
MNLNESNISAKTFKDSKAKLKKLLKNVRGRRQFLSLTIGERHNRQDLIIV